MTGHTGSVATLLKLTNQFLASGSYDNSIKIWNIETGQLIRTLQGHSDYVVSLSLIEASGFLASASWDETIKIWNYDTGECIITITGHTNKVVALVLIQNNILVSGSYDGTIKYV